MAWDLTFKIKNIKVKDVVDEDGNTLENAVFQTYWTVIGTNENGETEEQPGALPLSTVNANAATFTAFGDLTEEDVVGWIEAYYADNPDFLQNIHKEMDRAYARRTERDLGEKELPWYVPPEEAEDDAILDPNEDETLA